MLRTAAITVLAALMLLVTASVEWQIRLFRRKNGSAPTTHDVPPQLSNRYRKVGSPQQMEVSMHKLMHFTAGVAVGAIAIMVLIKTPTVATDLSTPPQTISVEGLRAFH